MHKTIRPLVSVSACVAPAVPATAMARACVPVTRRCPLTLRADAGRNASRCSQLERLPRRRAADVVCRPLHLPPRRCAM